MNRENLQKMADYIKTIPQDEFNMSMYRYGQKVGHICDSVGCIIGHCTRLDPNNLPKLGDGDINFIEWSTKFSGLNFVSKEWDWCFNGDWENGDNTAIGAAKRIEWLLSNEVPTNWKKQMYGEEKLSYIITKKNRIIHIGYTGIMRCYLNISDEEALKRYCQSEGVTEDYIKLNDQIRSFEFDDEFSSYAVYPNED